MTQTTNPMEVLGIEYATDERERRTFDRFWGLRWWTTGARSG